MNQQGIGNALVMRSRQTMDLEGVERFDVAQLDDVTSIKLSKNEYKTAYELQFYGKGRCRIIYERGRAKKIIGENIQLFIRKPLNILTISSLHFEDIEKQ